MHTLNRFAHALQCKAAVPIFLEARFNSLLQDGCHTGVKGAGKGYNKPANQPPTHSVPPLLKCRQRRLRCRGEPEPPRCGASWTRRASGWPRGPRRRGVPALAAIAAEEGEEEAADLGGRPRRGFGRTRERS